MDYITPLLLAHLQGCRKEFFQLQTHQICTSITVRVNRSHDVQAQMDLESRILVQVSPQESSTKVLHN
jgi:hypothetical protein